MQIVRMRPAQPGGKTRAYLDVQFDNGVIARGLRLVKTGAGMRVFSPDVRGELVVAIPSAVADQMVELAVAYENRAA